MLQPRHVIMSSLDRRRGVPLKMTLHFCLGLMHATDPARETKRLRSTGSSGIEPVV
jgi:hypothetical protein